MKALPGNSSVNTFQHATIQKVVGVEVFTSSAATCSPWFFARGFFYLKMEAIRSSETSVQSTTSTRRHTQEDGIPHTGSCVLHVVCSTQQYRAVFSMLSAPRKNTVLCVVHAEGL
jgi:hypothetical protein